MLTLALASFFLSLLAVALIKQRASQQFLDIPNQRSSHTQPTPLRYLVQLGAAGIAIASFGSFPQPRLDTLGMVGIILKILLTLVGMTALINLYNFMDDLDGILAGCSAIQLGFLALYLNQPLI